MQPKFTLVSSQFLNSMRRHDESDKFRIYEIMRELAEGTLEKSLISPSPKNSSILVTNVKNGTRIIVEDDSVSNSLMYINVVSKEQVEPIVEEYLRTVKSVESGDLASQYRKKRLALMPKVIPHFALGIPNRVDEIMKLEKAGLLLTRKQAELLHVPPPLFINGRAGSGKTIVLCTRLAQEVHAGKKLGAGLVFLSYNKKLVTEAQKYTDEISRGQYPDESCSQVQFSAFLEFLMNFVPDKSKFDDDHYVAFGTFKNFYETYKRGSASARRISAEIAWHGIRSILKGACKPPGRPPLTRDQYLAMAKRRRDFEEKDFEEIYNIGVWYQKEIIEGRKYWDDQDLAWEALNWIRKEKRTNPRMRLYEAIYCDEAQDLTEIQFHILLELARPLTMVGSGTQLILAGDPLQTINPTGFRWDVLKSEIYRTQSGEEVTFKELEENFRSDSDIVRFANQINTFRSEYGGKPIQPQESVLNEGDVPKIVLLNDREVVSLLKSNLRRLPPESAVIVWSEDEAAVAQVKEDEILNNLMSGYEWYTISEAKGLEFRVVILFKFGSSQDARILGKYLEENRKVDPKDEIPLLYFLNRLYVGVTRAKLYLYAVDVKDSERFWTIWKESANIVPRNEIDKFFGNNPAWEGEDRPDKWLDWGQRLWDQAELTRELSLFEKARHAFEKAGNEAKMKQVTARIYQLNQNWREAGLIYLELNDFRMAGMCFANSEHWDEAHQAYEKVPLTPQIKKQMAICKFKAELSRDRKKAASEFFSYADSDYDLEKKCVQELIDVLIETGGLYEAAQLLRRLGESDNAARANAGKLFAKLGDYARAEELLRTSGDMDSSEYRNSKAERSFQNGKFDEAIDEFSKLEKHEKVISTYMKAIADRKASRNLKEKALLSFLKLQRKNEASDVYETLLLDYVGTGDWGLALTCLEKNILSDTSKLEWTSKILSSVANSEETLNEEDKRRVYEAIRVVRDLPDAGNLTSKQMGLLLEKCARPSEVRAYYDQFKDTEEWAINPYIKASENLISYNNDLTRVADDEQQRIIGRRIAAINSDINRVKRNWGLLPQAQNESNKA